MPRKTRMIEMYVGISSGGDAGSWATEYIYIPADTKEQYIPKVAEKLMLSQLKRKGVKNVVFVGVYHIPPIDDGGE